jgi:hypothetical protein
MSGDDVLALVGRRLGLGKVGESGTVDQKGKSSLAARREVRTATW